MREIYRVSQETIDNIKSIRQNYVLIKIDDPNEYRRTASGIYLYVAPDTSQDASQYVDDAKHANRHGIVIKVCDRLKFNQDMADIRSLEYDVDIEVKEGDRVWFSYLEGLNCVEFYVDNPDKEAVNRFVAYKMIRYDSLRVKKDENGIRTLNGYFLIEPVYEELSTTVFMEKEKIISKGIIRHKGTPNKQYKTPGLCDDSTIKIGDTVLIKSRFENYLEDSIHKYFDKEYRVVKGCDVLVRINETA